MSPKKLKKDAQGNFPTKPSIKRQDKLSIDDLLFPKSIVMSLAKESIQNMNENSKVMISKDASRALQQASTVFVNHLLTFAREIVQKGDRKSCNEEDILNALEQIGLAGFDSIIREKMVAYNKVLHEKKVVVAAQIASTDAQIAENDNQRVNDDEPEYKRPKFNENLN